MNLIITLTVGTLGGYLLYKLKAPAGMLVGAIIAVSFLSIFTSFADIPTDAKVCAQIITGAYIGSSITKDDVKKLPEIFGPYLMVMGTFLVLNMLMGFIIYFVSPLDLLTALLCAMPGGISDTPLIAMDMGADVPKVALLQFVRMVFGISTLPLIISFVNKLFSNHEAKNSSAAPIENKSKPAAKSSAKVDKAVWITLAISAVCGILGNMAPVSAGALIFSMASAIALKMLYPKAHLPLWFRRIAQILSGCVIGCRIKRSDVLDLKYLIVPAVLLVLGYIINCILTGVLLNKMFGMSKLEGMLSASPAGATEMALIAADLGVTSPNLIVLQLGRLIGVVALFPQVIGLVVAVFS